MNDFDNNKLFATVRFHVKNKRKFIGMNSDITVRIGAEFFHHIIPGADDDAITDVVGGVGGWHSNASFQEIVKGNRGNGNRGDIGVKFIGGKKSEVPREFGSGGGIDSGGEIVGF